VVIEDNRIVAVGPQERIPMPVQADVYDGSGQSVLPGLIDAHFHLNNKLALSFMQKGITSLRDPGAWIETYYPLMASRKTIPRLFLTGPHFDMENPAYPENSVLVRDVWEAEENVRFFYNQGASAIKVYYGCSPAIIRQICQTAHELGIPVTAHLEITDIYQAIEAGLDGLEHITSLGSSLVPKRQAETYKQALIIDNDARRQGRYAMWATIDTASEASRQLAQFLSRSRTYICPTLGAFEYQWDPEKPDSVKLEGFRQMMAYTRLLYDHGARLVLGSHSWTPYEPLGQAYHHEMELWAATGIPAGDIIHAATLRNARFFGMEDRLGSIEVGKVADLVLVEGNPLEDISRMRQVKGVILNGAWLK
jgi:imidazolonepropionase-like amidohydrolase